MFSSRDVYDNDSCPVRDELLGEMYRASEHGLPKLVESVSSDVRAMLALSIASSCSERELIQFGGRAGAALYAQSRETPSARTAATTSYSGKKPITLSTKPLTTISPLDDELDEDFAEAVTA